MRFLYPDIRFQAYMPFIKGPIGMRTKRFHNVREIDISHYIAWPIEVKTELKRNPYWIKE